LGVFGLIAGLDLGVKNDDLGFGGDGGF